MERPLTDSWQEFLDGVTPDIAAEVAIKLRYGAVSVRPGTVDSRYDLRVMSVSVERASYGGLYVRRSRGAHEVGVIVKMFRGAEPLASDVRTASARVDYLFGG